MNAPREGPSDVGLAGERTTLAWTRLGLALLGIPAAIMAYGVMSTPGVVVDGKVVHAGSIPGPDQVRTWVQE